MIPLDKFKPLMDNIVEAIEEKNAEFLGLTVQEMNEIAELKPEVINIIESEMAKAVYRNAKMVV
jgi:hypothetical protein